MGVVENTKPNIDMGSLSFQAPSIPLFDGNTMMLGAPHADFPLFHSEWTHALQHFKCSLPKPFFNNPGQRQSFIGGWETGK